MIILLLQTTDDHFISKEFNSTEHGVGKRSTATTSLTEKSLDILRGRNGWDGRDGLPGLRGIVGPPRSKGDTGVPGVNGDGVGRVVQSMLAVVMTLIKIVEHN